MRRGVSTIVIGLIALVAILGTALFLIQSNSNLLAETERKQEVRQENPIASQNQNESSSISLVTKEPESK